VIGPIVLAGCLAGAGLAMIAFWLAPADPELNGALDRLDPDRRATRTQAAPPVPTEDGFGRIGSWAQRALPTAALRAPTADLRVLGISETEYLGQRVVYGVIGLLFPTLFTAVVGALGLQLPFSVPVVAGVALAAGLAWIPHLEVRRKAAVAREEFSRAVSAYIDLIAMEKHAGAGTSQAMETTAQVGDSWVFVRVGEELGRARWAGRPPWQALSALGEELQVSALADLGDIMRLAGEEGVAVYDALRARAASSRDAILAADHTRANQASEALAMPVAALGLVFLGLLAAPAVLRIAFS
jgi:pilus assembly protein TadC